MVPDVIGYPIRCDTTTERIEFRILEFLIEKLALPYRMPIILDVVDEQCWNFEPSESLYVPTYWPFLHHNLAQRRFLVDCVKYCSSSLRVAHEYEVVVIVESF
jgi:hypothetical protein